MRMAWLALKDLTVTARDPKTVLLMFAAPLAIMLLVGAIFFSETGAPPETTRQIAIGACVLDSGGQSEAFIGELSKRLTVNLGYGPDCPARMDEELAFGRIRAYVIVPGGFTENITNGRQAGIELKTDNSKPDISGIIASINQGIVYAAAQEMGRQFVIASWGELRNMSVGISALNDSLSQSQGQIADIRARTEETAARIGSVDTNALRESVHSSRTSIENLTRDAGTLRESVNGSAQDVEALSGSMASLQSAVTEAVAGIALLRGDIVDIENELASAYSDAYCQDAAGTPDYGVPAIIRWKGICADIESLNASLFVLDADLEAQSASLSRLNASAAETRARLAGVQAGMGEINDKLSALDELASLNETLAYMEGTVGDFREVQLEAAANLEETSRILESVSSNIVGLQEGAAVAKQKLDFLVSRDPAGVITPLLLSQTTLFGNIRYLDAMFPSIVAIILMFVTVLFSAVSVIREKSAGTMKRVLLSPATPVDFVGGKVALVLVIAVLQAALLLLVAWAAFSVKVNWALLPWWLVVIAGISITFSAIGMIIAALSDSENTALLASLVVCIPMLFLSGVFFPRELMIEPVRALSLASPLTQAVVLLEQLMVYNVDPLAAAAFATALLVWTIASLAAATRLVSGMRKK